MDKKLLILEEQDFLLKIARDTLVIYAKEGKRLNIKPSEVPSEKLKKEQGCFVTLHKNGQLRGCIGHILPVQELYLDVIDNAIAAGFQDPRFNSLEESELAQIEIEISVLTIPEKLIFKTSAELLEKLVPLKHGVILKLAGYQSTFLPQVWEDIPEKEDFLSQLSLKAGLNPNAWQDSNMEVYTYEAFVFGENPKK